MVPACTRPVRASVLLRIVTTYPSLLRVRRYYVSVVTTYPSLLRARLFSRPSLHSRRFPHGRHPEELLQLLHLLRRILQAGSARAMIDDARLSLGSYFPVHRGDDRSMMRVITTALQHACRRGGTYSRRHGRHASLHEWAGVCRCRLCTHATQRRRACCARCSPLGWGQVRKTLAQRAAGAGERATRAVRRASLARPTCCYGPPQTAAEEH